MRLNFLLVVFATISCGFYMSAQAQTRFWVADTPANWNSNNWANNSNGAPDGGGPPLATENARFDGNSNGNCTLNLALDTVANFQLINYTGTIEFAGNSIRATNAVTLNTGALTDNTGGGRLIIVSNATSNFNGTEIGVEVDVSSDNIQLTGSRFTEPCRFEKTGTGNSNGSGGNVFMDTVILIHSGSANNFLLGNGSPDTFNDFVSMSVTNGGAGYLAYNGSGHYFGGDVEVVNTNSSSGIFIGTGSGESTIAATHNFRIGASGFADGQLDIRNVTQLGNAPLNLSTTGTNLVDIFECSWTGVVNINAPRFRTRGTDYTDSVSITKTGASDDPSQGGNHFHEYTEFINNGSDYLMMGNGSPDSFDIDVSLVNTSSEHVYLANNSADNYIGGDLIITHSGTGVSTTYTYVSNASGSSITIDGNVNALNDGSSVDSRIIFGDGGSVMVNGNATFINSATGTTSNIQISNNSNASVTVNGVTRLVNDNATTTGNIYLGNQGDIALGDSLYISNSSTAGNSQVYCYYNSNSVATFGGDIVLENTNAASDGISFGQSSGSGTLAAGQTISQSGDFIEGTLYLRNFTQTGATSQALNLTSNASLTIYNCSFGGDVDFEAPNINTRGTAYDGNLTMRKTGATNDNQAGGNSVAGSTMLTNTGSGYWLWGNGSPDSFANNVTVLDSSSYNFYLAYNSTDNYIDGDLTINKWCAGTNTYTYLCDINGSSMEVTGSVSVNMESTSDNDRAHLGDNGTLTIGGDVSIVNNSSVAGYVYLSNGATASVTVDGDVSVSNGSLGTTKTTYLANSGSLNIAGRLDIDNDNSIDNAQVLVANNDGAIITIDGVTEAVNNGNGTTRRLYFGNAGSATFNDSLIILTSSDATNSEVYLNHASTSVNTYNGNILLECTEEDNDGVRFGNSQGVGTLAAGLTVSLTPNGFVGSYLYFRNFTQVGNTAQSLVMSSGTGYIYNRESSWGGDVVFRAPRMYTYDTRYEGTSILEKTGDSDDQCPGLNHFSGNADLICSGSGYLMMGNGAPDTFLLDLTMSNSGTRNMYLGYNSDGTNYIGGNFIIEQSTSGTGTEFYASNNASTALQVDGDVSISNTSTATTSNVYFGNQGDVNVNGSMELINSSNATTAQILVANGVNAAVNIGGHAYLTNSGTGGTTNRIFFGDDGDISVGDSLVINNSSDATNSEVLCNYEDSSSADYSGDIVLSCSNASSDGITFGEAGGSATLAAGQTVSVGAGGFIAGDLFFESFTQIGPTAQTILATGATNMYIQDSDWGGDVDFSAPRMRTLDTRYNGTASLSKTGSVDDVSNGGNYFTGITTLANSGDGYMMMGNSNPDTFMLDLDIVNNGSSHFYFARNSAGNFVGGDLSMDHSPSGTSASMTLGDLNGSSLTIDGNVDLSNTSTATSTNFYLGNYTDVVIGGDLTIDHQVNGNTNQLLIAYQDEASLSVGGVTNISISGAGNSSLTYLGYQGDIVFADSVSIRNASSATNSEVGIAFEDFSSIAFNGDILLESSNADCDGFRFSPGGGNSTLADGQRVVIGPNGFISGNLHFYNFHQIGNTTQSITTTGTASVYSEQNHWEADLTLIGPRNRTEDSDYDGALYFEKTGDTDDQSAGGNTIGGVATLVNSGSDYMMWGNGSPDTFSSDVILQNTGGEGIYIGYNAVGHYVAGNITGSNTGSGTTTWIHVGNNSGSTLQIDGDVELTNNGTGTTSQIHIGNASNVDMDGNLRLSNISAADNAYLYVASNSASTVNIGGVTYLENAGTGNLSRTYLGSSGSVNCADSLYLINSSGANNSQMYANDNSTSSNTYAGEIVLESSDADCDGIYFGNSNGQGILAAGQTVTLSANGFIAGNLLFRNFTQTGPTPQSLTLSGTALFENRDADWGGNVSFIAPRFFTRDSRYRGTAYLEKTGATDDASVGGNRIDGVATLVNSGSSYFLMGNGSPDSLMSNVSFTNSGSDNMYFAHNAAGNYIAGDVSINMSTTGAGTDYFYLSNAAASTLQIDGDLIVTNNATADDSRVYIGNNGDIDLDGNLTFTNTSSGTSSYSYVGASANSNVVINGVTRINQAPTGPTTHRFYLGESGSITFNDSLYITNEATSTNSEFYANRASNSNNTYNGHIILECNTPNADGIRFGEGNGSGTLSAGNTITIGPGGFTEDQLYIRNLTQVGATPQSLSLGGTGTILNIYDCSWDGDLDFDSPRTYTRGTTYNGDLDFEKTGSTNDASAGGNTYNGDVIFRNSGSGYQMIPNNVADDFNGDLTLIKTATGLMYPSYNATSTYAGNINIDANVEISFGANSGRIEFDGAAAQSINDLGASPTPNFRRMTLNKSADTLTLNMPIEVQTDATFSDGILNSDLVNLITFRDNASATGASHASFVRGYVEKIGNDAFDFPVGDSLYRPISISAPSSGAARFRATYFNNNPNPTYDWQALDAPINHVSTREYWLLDRTNLTNDVNVTLSWDVNSGGVDNLTDLLVARWDGDSWTSHGNGGTTGNTTAGTVTTSSAVTSFSPFTLASVSANNPLPIELLTFSATPIDRSVFLEWETATETNNDYFTVERSVNGTDFKNIGIVQGAGNSQRKKSYQLLDSNPLNGISYYRLKQTDFDGKVTTSQIEQVLIGEGASINVIALENKIQVSIESEQNEQIQLVIYNTAGELIFSEALEKSAERFDHLINQSVIGAAGIYLVTLNGELTQFSQRIFIR